jgi:hypothetical protein
MDITLPPDFKEFLRLLNTHNVEYLIIGGYAVGYHGYPRATNDMDIWIAIHPDNAERMVTVLRLVPGGVGKAGQSAPGVGADARVVLYVCPGIHAATVRSPVIRSEEAHPIFGFDSP